MWVMVVHHCLLHRSSAGSTSFEEVELDEDSTQAMKRLLVRTSMLRRVGQMAI